MESSSAAKLSDLRIKAHKLSKMFNDTFEDEKEKRAEIIRELVPDMDENGGFTTLNTASP